VIQHVWADNLSQLERWYGIYDDYVGNVRRTATDNDTVVVVSDHGMESDGIHSKRAFYACDKPLWDAKHRRMEELKTCLASEIPVHSASDRMKSNEVRISQEARTHLSDLGYFK